MGASCCPTGGAGWKTSRPSSSMARTQDQAWAAAYLAQAREDLEAAKKLDTGTSGTLAMLLQMVFEKAAKAAMLRMGTLSLDKARSTHIIASKLIADGGPDNYLRIPTKSGQSQS